jgi:hypothetical protein
VTRHTDSGHALARETPPPDAEAPHSSTSPVAPRTRPRSASAIAHTIWTRAVVENASSRAAYLVAFVLGAAFALRVFGLPFLLGTSDFWSYPPGDTNTQLTGYHFFVRDSWHWPLLRTTLVGPPQGMNVLTVDVIPIVALPAKLWSTATGHVANIYGLWMLSCYMLQATFATRLVRALGERSLFGAVIGSTIALSTYAFILRFFHEGLCAHFTLLWALALYFELAEEWHPWRAARSLSIVMIIALLCHPYLAAMTCAITAATVFRIRPHFNRETASRVAVLGISLALLVATGVACGHISGTVMNSQSSGYGLASLNLVAPFLPFPHYSAIWPGAPYAQEATGLQWDGAFFLGFGVLALIALHLAVSGRPILRFARAHAILLAAFLALTIYALSNQIHLSKTVLFTWPIPKQLLWLTGQFRSTGRLFWPVGYFIIIAVPTFTLLRFRRPVGVALAAICALVQVYDATTCIGIVERSTALPAPHWLDWAEWQPAIAAHARVRQLPSYDCDTTLGNTRIGFESREIQFMTALAGRAINGIRTARPSVNCKEEEQAIVQPIDEPDTLTLYPRVRGWHDRPACIAASTFRACSTLLERDSTLLAKTRLVNLPPYELGQIAYFFEPGDYPRLGFNYLYPDWGFFTGDRICTAGADARIELKVTTPKSSDYELGMNLIATFSVTEITTKLHVLAGDVEVGMITLTNPDDNDPKTDRIVRFSPDLAPNGEVRLTLRVEGEERLPPYRPTVGIYRFWLR